MYRILISIVAFLIGCGGVEEVPDVNDPNTDPKAKQTKTPQDASTNNPDTNTLSGPCTPDEIFCDGDQIKKCLSDGTSSILVTDCTKHNIADVKFTCDSCDLKTKGCKANKPYLYYKATTKHDKKYDEKAVYFKECNSKEMVGAASFNELQFKVEILTVEQKLLSVIKELPIENGKEYPFQTTEGKALDGQNWGIMFWFYNNHSKVDAKCTNYPVTSEYDKGTIRFTSTGKTKGSKFKLKTDGTASCDSVFGITLELEGYLTN